MIERQHIDEAIRRWAEVRRPTAARRDSVATANRVLGIDDESLKLMIVANAQTPTEGAAMVTGFQLGVLAARAERRS